MTQPIKVVILAGGLGTRLREETEYRPKPMVNIGNKPILWHIMKTYDYYGFHDFVVCLGYKGEVIKDYFLHYEIMNSDFTVNLGDRNNITLHNDHDECGWNVTLAETGEKSQTGSRVKKVEKYIHDDTFMLTYGDAVADINIEKLLAFHHSHGKIGTVTGVHQPSRFGELCIESQCVKRFSEKPQTTEGYISGGFFVFNKKFFSYLNREDECILEKDSIEKLSADNELMVYKHEGFWQCCDTFRELEILNNLWNQTNPPWKLWK
jgi:glucose-1-phosphate cytidylyltransferase